MGEDEIKKLFGKKIKELRKQKDLTQFSLGEKANINQRQVALIESGKSFPSIKTLSRFSDIFGCAVEDFFDFSYLIDEKSLRKQLLAIINNSSYEKVQTIYNIAKNLS